MQPGVEEVGSPFCVAELLDLQDLSRYSVEGFDRGQEISKKIMQLAIHIDRIRWATLG